jgi:nuclear cap-binding protein subunit 2
MVQKELEAQRELVDYGGSFQPNAPPPCKFYAIKILCY